MNDNHSSAAPSGRDLAWFDELAVTVARGRSALLARQHDDGHWRGAVETADPLEAELVLLLAFLGRLDDPRIPLAANRLLANEVGDDLGAAVRAYFALKIAGHPADAPRLLRMADAIRARGGAGAADPLTRTYLALLGQAPFPSLPAVQAVLLPKWLGGVGAHPEWQRAAHVALGVIGAHRPVTALPDGLGVSELFTGPVEPQKVNGRRPFEGRALRAAANWLRARYAEDGPDSGFRPLVLTAVALRCLGVPPDDAELRWVLSQIDHLCVSDGDSLRVRPFGAPVRDTALALTAAADAGAKPATRDAAEWLLERDPRSTALPRGAEAAALLLTALARGGHVMTVAASAVVYRGLNELLAAQNRDGGWAAFGRGVAGDPSCPETTGRVLEAIGHFGFRVGQGPVDAAVRFVLARQEPNGAWQTRWNTGALQATWPVLAGLVAVGFDVYGLPVRRAVRWLKEAQDADAGWGGPTETAWAVLGLLAAGEGESPEVQAGAEFLAGTQRIDGTWIESGYPAAGLEPNVSLRHELDALCLPLTALARYASDRGRPVQPRRPLVRADAGHALAGPKAFRHTLAEM